MMMLWRIVHAAEAKECSDLNVYIMGALANISGECRQWTCCDVWMQGNNHTCEKCLNKYLICPLCLLELGSVKFQCNIPTFSECILSPYLGNNTHSVWPLFSLHRSVQCDHSWNSFQSCLTLRCLMSGDVQEFWILSVLYLVFIVRCGIHEKEEVYN
jgi:hypothetical protein